MSAIRIRRTLDSDTLHLPELRPLLGRTVDIVVEEHPASAARDEFYAEVGRPPETEEAFTAQQERFRAWRADPRFEPFWPTLDHLLARDFETTRKWAAVHRAVQQADPDGYDYEAQADQDACDIRHAEDHLR